MAYYEFRPTTPLHFYTGTTGFEGIIRSRKLWLSDITASNDPREIKLGLDLFAAAMNALTDKDVPNISKRDRARFLANILAAQRQSTCYACCFGLAGDELPLWTRYADNGAGLSIAFRPTAMSSIPGRVQLVRYTDEKTADDLKAAAIQTALAIGKGIIDQSLAAGEAFAAVTGLKHRTWSYEREVRVIFNQRNQKPDPNELLSQLVAIHPDDSILEWREPLRRLSRSREVGYFEFGFGRHTRSDPDPRRAIEKVYIGPTCAMSSAEVRALLEGEGYEGFAVAQSECAIQ
jgi:hypothetical protein